MKKFLLFTMITVFAFSSTVCALDLDVLANIGANSAKFYLPVTTDIDFLFSFNSTVPYPGLKSSNSKEIDLSFLLGARTDIPFLGKTDIYISCSKWKGSINNNSGNTPGSALRLDSLVIAKNWMYRLTDRVNIGFSAILATFMLEDTSVVNILPSVSPAISCSIDIF
ncbi:MAG: hypothetical protein GY730_01120 [bacterium]|nr:hypothetical protein [bacterium]